jgi:OOP family OmpA-OmpF porin
MKNGNVKLIFTTLGVIAMLSTAAIAQSKVEGVIAGRSGSEIILRTADNPRLIVVLTDSTDVAQFEGVLKARKKSMSMAALIPGLPIQVEGAPDAQGQMVAWKVRFKGNDLQQAQAIQAGVAETHQQAQLNKEAAERNRLAAEQNRLATEQNKLAAERNRRAVEATNTRISNLDEYNVLDEVTVYFGNGKTKVAPQYNAQLVALAEKAKKVSGYMIQVKGFASTSGTVELNQKLSDDRAANVTAILITHGKVPLTNMLAPGAMGEHAQIEPKGADTEAQNRRVVVKVLQNKGIAGI